MRAGWWIGAWVAAAALLLLMKLPTLREPYFWDGVGCYYPQAQALARDVVRFLSSRPDFVRPPLYDGAMALLIRWVSDTPLCLHVATVIWVALTLPATYALTKTLGGEPLSCALATALCLVTPLFFAQSALIQTDMPATPLVTMAWLMALHGQWLGYALFGGLAALTKESSYFVCLPAAVLLCGRELLAAGRPLRPSSLSIRLVLHALPTAIPGMVLAAWLGVHRLVTGSFVASDHTAVIGTVPSTLSALLHNFCEGGRAILSMCALLIVVPLLRRRPLRQRLKVDAQTRFEILCTALLWVALPVCFPAGLSRYMAASLPALCTLAALGLAQLVPVQRSAAGALVIGALVGMWHGDSWHANFAHHVEGNMDYRQLLWAYTETANRLAAVAPRSVLAEFPIYHLLSAPPSAGYLETPLKTVDLPTLHTAEDVCLHDYVVTTYSTNYPVLQQAYERGYLTLWQTVGENEIKIGKRPLTPPWARSDLSLRIYQVRCPSGTTGSR